MSTHSKVKARFEALLLRLAASIVGGRNVARSMVVSRHDNNRMFEMGYELRAIAKRIEGGYETDRPAQQRHEGGDHD